MKYKSARSLYNNIGTKYHDNRVKASNDVAELPMVLKLIGDVRNKSVLDMGCGIGKHAKAFIDGGAKVVGYDASEKMVRYTKEYCRGKGTFFKGTHEMVVFENDSFDVVNASFTIAYSKELDLIFSNVHKWLKSGGIFTFSIPHSVWLLTHVDDMDFSKPHKVWIKMKSYDVEIYNYYYPLETYIQLINKYGFKLENLIETTVSRKYKGWREDKYKLPNAVVFKLRKS